MKAIEYPSVPPHNRDLSSISFNFNVYIYLHFFLVYRVTECPLRKRPYDGSDFNIPEINCKLLKNNIK